MRDVINKIIILQVMDKDTFKDDGIGEVGDCLHLNICNYRKLPGSHSSGLLGQNQEARGVEVSDQVQQAAQSKQEAELRETEAEQVKILFR